MKSRRWLLWLVLSLPLLAIVARIAFTLTGSLEPTISVATSRKLLEAAPLCPWRQPEEDMKTFFPGATHYRTQALILTSKMRSIKARLGRLPSPEENPLYLHRIYRHQQCLGSVITRRVKGEYGAIEIVLAMNKETVAGVRIQRMREPQTIAQALNSSHWLRSFVGKTSRDRWQLGQDIPGVPSVARRSAQAIVENVRSLLILHEIGENPKFQSVS